MVSIDNFSTLVTESENFTTVPTTNSTDGPSFEDDDDDFILIIISGLVEICFSYGGQCIVAFFIAIVTYLIYSHLIYPFVFRYYKIGYHSTLSRLKKVLEEAIPIELQGNKNVVKQYLQLYHEFCKLRVMAKRDYRGVIDRKDTQWSEFDVLNFKNKGYITRLKRLQA